MARQTRRRRDSKSKNRFRPRLTSAFSRDLSTGKDVTTKKSEKVHWPSILILMFIFLFSLYIRTAWTIGPATEDGFELTGGSDPYYHKRVVDHVVETGEHLQRDEMLNYPYGANNNRPPLFDWSIAIIGLAMSPFFSSPEESVWWAMEVLPAIYGAMIVFPVYAIGRAQFGREAGLIGAFLIGVNSAHVSHSSLALADHDSYIILFGTTAYFFFMRALTLAKDKKWVSDWTDFDEIKNGFYRFVNSERIAIGYAGLAGITITMISMSWKGFPYIMAIIAIYLGFQMLINAFRRIDSLTTAMLGFISLSMPVLLSYPYYKTMGFIETWWEAPAYILLGYTLISILMVTTRDLPWLLVIGSSIGIGAVFYLLLTYVFTDLGFLLFSGQGYFVRTKLFNTIAEAQPPEFADFVFAFGPVSLWLGLFGIVWMAYQLFNQSLWKKDYLFVMIWALVSIYMAQSAIRFIFNATPVVCLISGWITWLILQWADFPSAVASWRLFWGKRGDLFYWLSIVSLLVGLWAFFTISILVGILSTIILLALVMVVGHMDAQGEDQYRFRDRLGGLRKSIKLRRPLVAIFVGLFIFLPNTFYGYDAGVPYEDKKEHDVSVYNFLSYSFLRPDEYINSQKSNSTIYPEGVGGMYNLTNNQLWYMGNTGPSFPSDYWIEGFKWLAEQDTNLKQEDRPGFISWWDYGFWAIDIGEHPTVADNFQFGYQIAGNFIASQSEQEAMALLLYRLLEPEVDRSEGRFGKEIREKMLEFFSEEEVASLEHIITNPSNYIPKNEDGSNQDVHKKNAAIRAGKPILMSIEKDEIANLMWEVEQITGHSIRYFAADTRLMPYSAENTGILYAPVTLADYNINDFFEIKAVLSSGETVSYDEAYEILTKNPEVQVTSQTLEYKDKFLNSTFFRAFIGWSALDLGKDIEEGIPGISGTIAQDNSLPPLFGWNMTHFKLVHSNNGLRILKYYDGATIYGTVSTPEGNPVVDANITVLDEYKIPHATVITDKNGYYSITVPAGNLTLAASLGTPQADVEIIRKTSNNLLMTKDGIIISEEQATRQTAHEVNIDLIVEPATVSGKIYWDYGGDDSFDSEDDALPLIEVKVENVKSGVELYSTTDFAGDYYFDGLAPGEYEITATVEGHSLELKSYKGQASIKANQDLTVDASLKPASVWGKFSDAGLGTQTITVSLEDQTNSSVIQQSFLSTTHSSSKCYTDLVSYCFSNLLPGKYKVSMTSNDVFTGWTNNTIELEIGEGESKSYNGSLAEGFRIEGILAHNGNPITNQQLSINNVNGQYGDNILTAENGYFTTVVPRGIYNLYTVNENNQTTLAYLGLVDTDTKPELINANMDSAFVLKGVLFNDINGNGKYEPEKEENGYPDFKIEFDSGHGTTSVVTSVSGTYSVLLPQGEYGIWSHKPSDEFQRVALYDIQVDQSKDRNITHAVGHDVFVLAYEEHMNEVTPISATIKFSSGSGWKSFWIDAQGLGTVIPLPDTLDSSGYNIDITKFGYRLVEMYYGPEESKVQTNKLVLDSTKELLIKAERIPTTVTGRLVHQGKGVENAELSFSPIHNLSYNITFKANDEGYFDINLPPEHYMYVFSYESEEGSRYFAQNQIEIPIGTESLDMGEIETDLTYKVSGMAKLDDEDKDGHVIFRPVDNLENLTVFYSNRVNGYSGHLKPGNYYVTFQDGRKNDHYSFGELLELDNPTELDIDLVDEGAIEGDIISEADNNRITDRIVKVQFISDDGVKFVEESVQEDGLFGTDAQNGRFDLPNGEYTVVVESEGYEKFENVVTIDGQTDYYGTISLTPKLVNVTLDINYQNATGKIVPLKNTTVRFSSINGEPFSHKTSEDGNIVITGMVPKNYDIEINETQNDGADQFELTKQSLYVKAGKDNQTFTKNADWKVRISGNVYYDRDYNGKADSSELLGNSIVEIWDVDGDQIEYTATSGNYGNYELYVKTGSYKTWTYNTENTIYVDVGELKLDEALNWDPSLTKGVNYNVKYVSSENSEGIDLGIIDIKSTNFSFEKNSENNGLDLFLTPGKYDFNGKYEDLEASDDYIYQLSKSVNITDEMDGVLQTEIIEKKIMRGIEITLDMVETEIPIGQAAEFTFNIVGTGEIPASFEPSIDEIPENWTATFEPDRLTVHNGTENNMVLSITPNDGVVPNLWETFFVEIGWSDNSDNGVDDIKRSFTVTVTPIEKPKPDFEINELIWTPEVPIPGSKVTLTATISNTVNHSGSHYVPIVFYADENPIGLTTAMFNGSGEDVVVSTIWNSTAGSHSLKVIIDPEQTIEEESTEDNEQFISISVQGEKEEETDDTLKIAALVVVGLVAGLAYVSYRSRRT